MEVGTIYWDGEDQRRASPGLPVPFQRSMQCISFAVPEDNAKVGIEY